MNFEDENDLFKKAFISILKNPHSFIFFVVIKKALGDMLKNYLKLYQI
ncbi:hypothetical protein Metvu_0606 [Methanocaldococcus vulcanius M7]|uniref:Uncharacterized protein n=1 Tax=Methanocaldococcus vulcanius (strain ATCC 700851 / DSM 12094 / M7) TaxID=579137 RepID=C9RFW3_METVM|nr:hypothetical protein Metvu_0606 [Methanocaldococcus vulcanius M7]